jgi:hypothetical protein
LAVPLERRPQQAVVVVKKGVVWFDEGPVFFERFGSEKLRLGPGRLRVLTRGPVVSSARAVVVCGGQREGVEEDDTRFLVSVLPGAFESIRYPPLFGDAGCKGWEPSGPRVLADDELVVAGKTSGRILSPASRCLSGACTEAAGTCCAGSRVNMNRYSPPKVHCSQLACSTR